MNVRFTSVAMEKVFRIANEGNWRDQRNVAKLYSMLKLESEKERSDVLWKRFDVTPVTSDGGTKVILIRVGTLNVFCTLEKMTGA
jgi:hypothetical protein